MKTVDLLLPFLVFVLYAPTVRRRSTFFDSRRQVNRKWGYFILFLVPPSERVSGNALVFFYYFTGCFLPNMHDSLIEKVDVSGPRAINAVPDNRNSLRPESNRNSLIETV